MPQIFDCDYVTGLLLQWQASKSPELEAQILEGCTNLIEALVSKYGAQYRDELIQEAYIRILYACNYYNVNTASLHSYLTSVIRNTCLTFLSKQPKDLLIEDITSSDEDDEECSDYTDAILMAECSNGNTDLLTELIERNRVRFPSVPTTDIDDLSEHIYYALKTNGTYPKELPRILAANTCIPVATIRLICSSSIIWMRSVNISNAAINPKEATEFTLLKDLQDIVDPNTYKLIRIAFSGMTLRMS